MTKAAVSKAASLIREAKEVLEKGGIIPGSDEHSARANLQNALDLLEPRDQQEQ